MKIYTTVYEDLLIILVPNIFAAKVVFKAYLIMLSATLMSLKEDDIRKTEQ